jgi:prolipoprotein diacylglyceryl transferase
MYLLGFNWNPDGTLFNIGFIQIKYYNLLWILTFVVGWFLMKKIFKKERKSMEQLDSLFMHCVISIILGARLGHVIFYDWDYYKNHLLEILLPIRENATETLLGFIEGYEFIGFAGLASHGATIGALLALFLFSKKHKDISFLWILDRVAVVSAIGTAFVRVGNFFNSEINGNIVDKSFVFATRMIRDSDDMPSYKAMQLTKENTANAAFKAIEYKPEFAGILQEIPYRHPVQLYEAFFYLLLFGILWYTYWKTNKRKKQGFLFGLFMIGLWSSRFVAEYFKKSQGGFEDTWGTFSTGQWLSIPLILLGLFFMFKPATKIQ